MHSGSQRSARAEDRGKTTKCKRVRKTERKNDQERKDIKAHLARATDTSLVVLRKDSNLHFLCGEGHRRHHRRTVVGGLLRHRRAQVSSTKSTNVRFNPLQAFVEPSSPDCRHRRSPPSPPLAKPKTRYRLCMLT